MSRRRKPPPFYTTGGGGGFNPLVLPSAQAWTAAYDAATATVVGGVVTVLPDITGNGFDALAPVGDEPGYTPSNAGFNNQATYDIPHGDIKRLLAPDMGLGVLGITIVIVGSSDYVATPSAFFMASRPDAVRIGSNGAVPYISPDAFTTTINSTESTPAVASLLICEFSGPTSSFAWSAATPDAGVLALPALVGSTWVFGNFAGWAGSFAQEGSTAWIGVLKGTLSPADKAYLRSGFGTKYGIPMGP